jgi:hypothetical protein
MKIEECQGYKKLMDSVMHDVSSGQGCFNLNGCDHEFYHTVQQDNPKLVEMGFKTACKHISNCTHKYCDKFKWVLDRANHYAEKTGCEASEILDVWENARNYWYMNYYQESNQPEIKADSVKIFETIDDLLKSIGKDGFRCPRCKGVSTDPYECNSGVIVKNIKDKNDGPCNWKGYGLFQDLGKGIYIFVKDKLKGERIFMPISWEKLNGKK